METQEQPASEQPLNFTTIQALQCGLSCVLTGKTMTECEPVAIRFEKHLNSLGFELIRTENK